ncbi:hypothetical protein A4A49_39327, partial [Nicotiana attenuata]
ELTTVSIVKLSIPIEELTKGAVYHEAASVEKKLEDGKVSDKFKDVTADHNTVGDNEVSFSKITSNEENVLSKDEPLVSENTNSTIESIESGENLKENESLGVECNDTKEAQGIYKSFMEQLLLHGLDEEVLEIVDLIAEMSSDSDEVETAQLTLEENKEFTLPDLELPVVIAQPLSTEGEAVSVEKELEVANHPMVEVTDVVTTADFNGIRENEVVSTSTVSPATESQVYSAGPSACNPECTVIKETSENLMAKVMEFESSMHSFKETLQKALDKLNANSY